MCTSASSCDNGYKTVHVEQFAYLQVAFHSAAHFERCDWGIKEVENQVRPGEREVSRADPSFC